MSFKLSCKAIKSRNKSDGTSFEKEVISNTFKKIKQINYDSRKI
jgi:hypothetical protein